MRITQCLGLEGIIKIPTIRTSFQPSKSIKASKSTKKLLVLIQVILSRILRPAITKLTMGLKGEGLIKLIIISQAPTQSWDTTRINISLQIWQSIMPNQLLWTRVMAGHMGPTLSQEEIMAASILRTKPNLAIRIVEMRKSINRGFQISRVLIFNLDFHSKEMRIYLRLKLIITKSPLISRSLKVKSRLTYSSNTMVITISNRAMEIISTRKRYKKHNHSIRMAGIAMW